MDLMTLVAKLTLDDSSYKKGISSAESQAQNFTKHLSALTVAAGNIISDVAMKGISSITGAIQGAMDGYANYQQLIGGVQTLFQTSANRVAEYAKKSFKTTGLSANDYMETVTSFSASLLQGLNGDTDAAADLADTAITDMADNANKMGTNIKSIQMAYQGFAKQNYTMLDNLKLGYGGTKNEMVRLINDSGILEHEIKNLDGITFDQLIQAIHAIQVKMEITGTTAMEAADTISGSKSSVAAAWKDLLSAVGGEGGEDRLHETLENFKASFSAYIENFIPTLVTTITNSGSLVTAIADSISSLPSDLLSKVAESGLSSGTEMVGGISKITGWLIDSITNMFKSASIDNGKVAEFGKAIGDFLGNTISQIVTNAPAILEGIVNVGIGLAGGLIEGLFQGLFGSGSELDTITNKLGDEIAETNVQTSKASAILEYMDSLVKKYGSAVKESHEWKQAQGQLEEVLGGSDEVFKQYGDNVQGAIDKLKEMTAELRRTAIINAMSSAIEDEYKLLGEKTAEMGRSQARQQIAQNQVDAFQPMLVQNLQAYAQAALDENAKNNYLSAEQWAYYDQIRNGTMNGVSLSEIGSEELIDALIGLEGTLETLYGANGEETPLWDKDKTDNLFSVEEIKAQRAAVLEAQNTIEAEIKTQADLQTQIAQIEEQIKVSELAFQNTAKSLADNSSTASTNIASGGDEIASALGSVAGKIRRINLGRNGFSYVPEATGIDDVPIDGYRAELHKHEAVLDKTEAEAWRNGRSGNSFSEEAMEEAVINAFSRLYINMDGNRVADFTTRRMERNISASSAARVRSMGG